jgi:hypothetical protein
VSVSRSDRTEIEIAFLSGDYSRVLLRALDHPDAHFENPDLPFVVGALVFLGRSDEAAAIYRGRKSRLAEDDMLASLEGCRFFLCIGECRAGRYDAAEKLCRENLKALHGAKKSSLRARFYFHQGMGIVHYFRGRIAHAARHAAKARGASVEAQFPFGRMLSMDLLGHALVQVGKVHAGLTLLGQGADLAESFGFATSANTSRGAVCIYRVQRGLVPYLALEAQLDSVGKEDVYSRRMLLMEIAVASAMSGAATGASEYLKAAIELALPDGDHRGRIRLCVAHALVFGLSNGEAAAMPWLQEANALLRSDDLALQVEVRLIEYLVAPECFSERTRERAKLSSLALHSGTARARFLSNEESELSSAEDLTLGILRRLRRGKEAIEEVLQSGLLGLIPRCLGFSPGRRIYIDAARDRLIIEDNGTLHVREGTPARTAALLEALRFGPQTKEELLLEVWKIKNYSSDRHDAVVYTTISRVRTFLDAQASWLQATDAGYALSHVEVVVLTQSDQAPSESDVDPERAPSSPPNMVVEKQTRSAQTRDEYVLALLSSSSLSTPEVATRLKVSEMTAFRILSALAKQGAIERHGAGKNTRYQLKR